MDMSLRLRSTVPLALASAVLIAIAAGPRLRAQSEPPGDDSESPFAHLAFRNIGPSVAGGRVSAVAGVPGDPNIYYVAAAAGGVWKTTNAGNTWEPIFEKQPVPSIGAVALAPSNPNVVWVGTGEANIRNDIVNGHGVYVSPDAGRSWRFAGLKDVGQIARIVVDPHDPDTVLVAALGHAWAPNPDRGVFRTTDGGRTWTKTLFVDDQTGATDLVMQPGNPRVLFAAMWQVRRFPWELVDGGPGSAIYRSTDGGRTWAKLTEGLPEGPLGRIALAIAPSKPDHVFALVESKAGILWDSHDLGDHWTMVTGNHALNVRPFYFSQITVSPVDDGKVYFSSYRLMASSDGGKTVKVLDPDVHPDHHALWIDPEDPDRMLQGNDGGVFLSHDGGTTWQFLNNLPIGQFYMVAADARVPYNLCGGLQDNSAWCGPSNTLTRSGNTGAEWIAVVGGDGEYAVPAPSNPDIVYTDSQNGFIERLDLKTNVSRSIRPYLAGVEAKAPADLEYRFNWTSPIVVSPKNADEVYLGANVVFKTTDGGTTWNPISPDLTNNDKSKQRISGGPIEYDISGAETYDTILSITLAPTDPNVIWVGTDDGNVQVTRDGGKSWKNVRPRAAGLPAEGRVYQVGVSPFDAGTAYIAIDYHMFANNKPYVFKTTDYGATWTSIASGLPDDMPAHVVREDPNQRGLLVLGTDNALWFSRDAGATWRSLAPAFPTAPVFDVQFVPGTHALAVATHGRGLFVLDSMAPLEEWTDAVQTSALHLFRPDTAIMFHRRRPHEPPSRFRAPNPPTGAALTYYLAREMTPTDEQKKAKEGPVAVTVADAQGHTIYTGHAPGKRGFNQYAWNLRYEGPTKLQIGQASTPEEESFGTPPGSGPQVVPGTYTIALTAGTITAKQTVEVRPDPNLPFDASAAQAQLAAGLALRDSVSSMNRMLNGLHGLRAQVGALQAAMKDQPDNAERTQVLARAGDIANKAKALMDKIYNPDVQRGVVEDDIHHLTQLYDQLTSMDDLVSEYNQAPTPLARERIAEAQKELDGYLSEYRALIEQDVVAFNKTAAQQGAPVLIAAPVK